MIEPITIEEQELYKFIIGSKEFILTPEEVTVLSIGKRIKTLVTNEQEVTFEEFRDLKRELRRLERQYKRGKLIHISKVTNEMWQDLTKDYYLAHGKYPKQKGHTYVKDTEKS